MIITKSHQSISQSTSGHYVFHGGIIDNEEVIIDIPGGVVYVSGKISSARSIVVRCRTLIAHGIKTAGALIVTGDVETTLCGINALQGIIVNGSISSVGAIFVRHGVLEVTGCVETRGYIEVQGNIKSGGNIKAESFIQSQYNIRADYSIDARNVIAGGNVMAKSCNVEGFISAGGYVLIVSGDVNDMDVRAKTIITPGA